MGKTSLNLKGNDQYLGHRSNAPIYNISTVIVTAL